MTIAMEPLRCKLAIPSTTIDQFMSFECLGCRITSTGLLKEEMRKQSSDVSGHLKNSIWKNKHISTPSKIRISKTCTRSSLKTSKNNPKEITKSHYGIYIG